MNRLILIYSALKNKLLCCLVLLMMLIGDRAVAQSPLDRDATINYAGKDFWFTLARSYATYRCVFYITGTKDANITFEYNLPRTTQNYTHKANTITRVVLSFAEVTALAGLSQPLESVNRNSLHITSDENVAIQFLYIAHWDGDGLFLLPSDNQDYGPDYYLNGPKVQGGVNKVTNPTYFSIVSRSDNVVLEITPTRNTRYHAAGVPFTVLLNKGESYILAGGTTTDNISGTKVHVKSSDICNPINIFNNYAAIFVQWPKPPPFGPYNCCGDPLLEQLTPINAWDTVYPVVKFANNPYNVISIVSASNNNVIYYDGVPIQTLADGQQYDTIVKQPAVITSSAPISITQHMLSQGEVYTNWPGGGVLGPTFPRDSASDPSTMWVFPMRDGIREAYFKAPVNIPTGYANDPDFDGYEMNKVTLICKAASANTILLNNVNIGAQFTPFPSNPNYMHTVIKLDTSITYHLVSRDKVVAYYYGAYIEGSAAYPIGNIGAATFSHTDTVITMCINDSSLLSADAADTYVWYNGDTTKQVTVSDSGLYYVDMFYKDACGTKGITKYFQVNTKAYAQEIVSETIYKCLHEELVLTANAGASKYLWSNGDTVGQISITALGGAYKVTETFHPECREVQHYFSIQPKPVVLPRLDIGADTIFCPGGRVELVGAGDTTTWSDGSVGEKLVVEKPGIYWGRIDESCFGTFVTDTMVVMDTVCLKDYCNLVFPSAFTPNEDGRNDIFRAIYYGMFPAYHLMLFNRWGAVVYETYDITQGWNGIYKGMPAEIGVYYYTCSYTCPLKGDLFTKGEATLIR